MRFNTIFDHLVVADFVRPACSFSLIIYRSRTCSVVQLGLWYLRTSSHVNSLSE